MSSARQGLSLSSYSRSHNVLPVTTVQPTTVYTSNVAEERVVRSGYSYPSSTTYPQATSSNVRYGSQVNRSNYTVSGSSQQAKYQPASSYQHTSSYAKPTPQYSTATSSYPSYSGTSQTRQPVRI